MTAQRWGAWVRAEMDRRGWNASDAAREADVHRTAFSAWLKGDHRVPEIDTIRKVAAAFNRPLLEALVAADLITEEEARITRIERTDAGALETDELLDELRARFVALERENRALRRSRSGRTTKRAEDDPGAFYLADPPEGDLSNMHRPAKP